MKKIKLRGLSLFSNVGVAEAYLRSVGVKIEVANEFIPERAKFYREVYPETLMIEGDITDSKIFNEVIYEAKKRSVDFLIATPPCQGMSEAGLRLEFDERNQLISYAVEAIKQLKPRFVLLENVPQQLKTKIRCGDEVVLIPEYVKRSLGDMYNFNRETLVKAKDYGVPQLRERNIFLLVRKDQNIVWEFPEKQRGLL
jgi:DNA (cytosine-5)-methyltransferase 1